MCWGQYISICINFDGGYMHGLPYIYGLLFIKYENYKNMTPKLKFNIIFI